MYSTIRNAPRFVTIRNYLPPSFRCWSSENESGVVKSLLPDADIPNVSIPEYVLKNVHRYPQKIALECGVTGRKYTYDDVLIKSRNFGKALRKRLNFKRGDIVAIMLPNVPEYPICIFGCLQANIVVTTINPAYTPGEISKQLLDTDAKAIITLAALYPTAESSLQLTKQKIPIIVTKINEEESLPQGAINLHELINDTVDIEDVPLPNSTDTAVLLYSSGTTGLPKGVQLTHKNITANISQANDSSLKLHLDTTESHQDIIPAFLPIFHAFGLTSLLLTHLRPLCKILTVPYFTPEVFLNILKTKNPHLLFAVPSLINLISNHPAIKSEYVQSIRAVICAAAPLSVQDEEKFFNKVGADLAVKQGYGLTEASPCVSMTTTRTTKLGIHGSSGELLPNTMAKLINKDNSVVLQPNEPGELLVKGPQVMKGYFNRPEENKKSFVDGYFKTGDLCYFDRNQFLFVVERIKDLIKVKGFQVAPAELEDLLRTHPDVLDAAVIGVNVSKHGEVPRAYVVAKPNRSLKINDVTEYVAKNVVDYKRLVGGVSVLDSLPKNSTGKILRKELKRMYEAGK